MPPSRGSHPWLPTAALSGLSDHTFDECGLPPSHRCASGNARSARREPRASRTLASYLLFTIRLPFGKEACSGTGALTRYRPFSMRSTLTAYGHTTSSPTPKSYTSNHVPVGNSAGTWFEVYD